MIDEEEEEEDEVRSDLEEGDEATQPKTVLEQSFRDTGVYKAISQKRDDQF